MNVVKKNKSKSKARDIILFIIFKLILDFTYVTFQYKLFGYYGFDLTVNYWKIFLGWIIYFITGLFVQTKDKSITSIFTYMIFLLSFAPFVTFYQYNSDSYFWMLLYQSIPIIIMSVIFKSVYRKNHYDDKKLTNQSVNHKIRINDKKLNLIVITFLLIYFVYMFAKNGLPSLYSITFANISTVRAEYESSTFFSIIQTIVCKIICPLLLFKAIKEKKFILLLLIVIVELYTYAVTGFKTYLFVLLLSAILSFIPKMNIKKLILVGLPLAVVLTDVEYIITGNNMLYALINERVLFLPAKIKNCYFDFFSRNDFIWFSQSSFAKILNIQSNYSENIPNLIGDLYFNRPGMWTNTGFIADAYANAGILGIAFICLLLVFVLLSARKHISYIHNSYKKGIEILFVLYFISLNDGGAISVLFSGGMLILLILIMVIDFNVRVKTKYIFNNNKFEEVSI